LRGGSKKGNLGGGSGWGGPLIQYEEKGRQAEKRIINLGGTALRKRKALCRASPAKPEAWGEGTKRKSTKTNETAEGEKEGLTWYEPFRL